MAYDTETGAERFRLPPGRLAADGQHYLAARTGPETGLFQYDLSTGAEAPLARLAGAWALSAVSPTGRWAALARIASDSQKQTWTASQTWQSTLQVVDTQAGPLAPPLVLAGNFEVDALAADGATLFVIQYLPAVKPDHYQVRVFDLASRALQDGALVDKRSPDEVMAGQRVLAVAPRDGSWLYTLYLRTKNNSAFVHALDTVNKYTLCFDLPDVPGATLDQLRAYSLALAPNGLALYAANPALGLVARIDLSAFESARAASFAPAAPGTSAAVNASVADGRALYFSSGPGLWRFDTATRQVTSLAALGPAISGLALSRAGQQLWVARPAGPAQLLDSASGQRLSGQ